MNASIAKGACRALVRFADANNGINLTGKLAEAVSLARMAMEPVSVQKLAALYKWDEANTGGGCMALERDLKSYQRKLFALITQTDEPSTPTDAAAVCALSIYDRDSENAEPLVSFHMPSVEQAMQLAERIQ